MGKKKKASAQLIKTDTVNWKYYPPTAILDSTSEQIIDLFKRQYDEISSNKHTSTADSKSDVILSRIRPSLEEHGFTVEKGKSTKDKIRVPVLFGINGEETTAFEVDAYNKEERYVVEVEAGQAVINYKFLKDLIEACIMPQVDYLCIAVRNVYKTNKDIATVIQYIDALYSSHKLLIPLKGLLVIGY